MALLMNPVEVNREMETIKATIATLELADEAIFNQNDKDILMEKYTDILNKLQSCMNLYIMNLQVNDFTEL